MDDGQLSKCFCFKFFKLAVFWLFTCIQCMIIVGVCDVVPSICVIKNSVLANFKVQQAMGHHGQNPFSY